MAFDPKLLPLFDRTDPGQLVVERVEKAELVCQLNGVQNIECVVPMRLSGGAYAVYQQLSEEKRANFTCIKDVLYTAFALNPVTAYKQFAAHHLCPGETVDVFLAELRKLATQFGGMMEQGLVCAFIAGLLEHAEKLLQATTWVDDMPISEILAHAQAILKDSFTGTGLAATAAQLLGCQEKETAAPRRCYIYQGPNHKARDGLRWCECPRPQKSLTFNWCKRQGHIARNCPGNEQGGQVFSTSLFPKPHLNGTLPAVTVQIDRVRCTALVDTGCTQTMLSDVG